MTPIRDLNTVLLKTRRVIGLIRIEAMHVCVPYIIMYVYYIHSTEDRMFEDKAKAKRT